MNAGGDDSVTGGGGDDVVDVGATLTAADSLDGGAGLDELHVRGGGGTLVVGSGVSGFETIVVGAGASVRLVFEAGALQAASALSIRGGGLGSSEALVVAAQGLATGLTVVAGAGSDSVATGSGSDALSGGDGNDRLDGGAGQDTLEGGAGKDTLVGGADVKADVLKGGDGDDTYYVTSLLDTIAESSSTSGGVDLVVSTADRVPGQVPGAPDAGRHQGHRRHRQQPANVIRGNAAGNVLDGGSKGQDTLIGGLGNDAYHVNGNDTVVERSGGGTDRIHSSTSYTLAKYFEDLTLTGTRNLSGTGHSGANRIDGNAGNNVLDGGSGNDTLQGFAGSDRLLGGKGDDKIYGGDGADTLDGGSGRNTLAGGDGADTYFVDSKDDVVVEKSRYVIEIDTVISSVDRTGANQDKLVLTGKALVGIGSSDDNWITGTDRANVLDGRGGYDTMVGGKGNDTYHVDRPEDSVIESWNGGVDHVIASSDWTLGIYEEHLTLTSKQWSTGYGNELGNRIEGGRGLNSIDGMGGDDTVSGGGGNDRLWGGAGKDRLDGGTGNDTIISGRGATSSPAAPGTTSSGSKANRTATPVFRHHPRLRAGPGRDRPVVAVFRRERRLQALHRQGPLQR
ncbi:hypothetical protein HK414_02600 [Ramlibacter terrae]|uniref:Calcium-binding protein n=1 Tax=Ramlibacter terrae TaxID=2732511 RepID=A0ABX6P078_9BURK|nr:hypothetical protein HK414_02600 [Ramlibacter terrae]